MGKDRINILQLRAGKAQKIMFDFHHLLPHHGTAVALDEVINFGNAAGGGILNGHDAIVNIPLLHRLHHIFKEGEIEFLPFPVSKLLLHGLVGIGALSAVAADPNHSI